MLNLTTNLGCAVIQVPNENKVLTQKVDRLQKIKEKGVITVLSSNNEPYSYKNPKTGEFSGIDADIIREVAKRLGVKEVNVKYSFFSSLFEDLVKNPDIDLVADGIFITDERKQLADFTIPVYNDWGGILTRKDSGINRKEDLKNTTLGAIRGEVYDPIVQEWKNQGLIKDYVIFSDRNSLKIALKNKIIDAFLTDSIIAQNIIIKNPELNFKLLSPTQYEPEVTFNIGYPLKKEDTTLLNAINEKLQDMKNDGTLYEILTNYGIRDHYTT
jgi:polar amino acid transport system substrate-binding protein